MSTMRTSALERFLRAPSIRTENTQSLCIVAPISDERYYAAAWIPGEPDHRPSGTRGPSLSAVGIDGPVDVFDR
jgi:hypothetical protein